MKKLLLILFIFSYSFISKGAIHQIQVWNGYYQFLPPNNITVQLGDTIQWTPLDPPTMTHTITSDSIPAGATAFNQIWQLPADTFFQYIPQVVGLYKYVCTPHINFNMIGEFTVVNGTNSQYTYVPDDNFEAVLESILVGNGIANDDSVSTNAIRMVTQLNLVGLGISDLTGIEGFDSLQILECSDNHLTTLDMNSNTVLTYLDCNNNQLISLDVNTGITYLNCNNNQLTTLDVSMNTALIHLHCDSNNIISLDVSNNLVLSNLRCGYNQLATLDVNSDTALIQLWCNNNQLTSLNVSNNLALTVLRCNHNQLMSLDVSNNTNLIALRTHNNQCTSLNVNGATSLSALWCQNNQLNSLDVSSNTALISLRLFNNQLINLDITNNTALNSLNCYNNQLNSLNLRNGNNINFSALNVIQNPNLYCIDVDDSTWSANNWTVANFNIDPQHYFSNNCSGTAIEEHFTNKKLLQTIDILGRETKNNPLFYIYDDGTVEKRITLN